MSDANKTKYTRKIRSIVYGQAVLGIMAVIVCFLITKNINSTFSALLGFIIAIVPTLSYIWIAFGNGMYAKPKDILKKHKNAMQLKFVVNFLLFAVTFFIYKNCNFLALFIVYCVTLAANWINLFRVNN